MKLLFFFTFILPLMILRISAQPAIEWENTIGGSGDDLLTCIQQTNDGGYIVGGISDSEISGEKTEGNFGYKDYWVVKLDSTGNIEWQNTIGAYGYNYLASIKETSDGYLLGGYSSSEIGGDKTEASIDEDFWIVKLDFSGVIVWQNTITGPSQDRLAAIGQTTDGGFILGGSSGGGPGYDMTDSTCTGDDDYWLVKIDSIGNVLWDNALGGDATDLLRSLHSTNDEGYILLGSSNSLQECDKSDDVINHPNEDNWVVLCDSVAMVLWDTIFAHPSGGGSINDPGNIIQVPDGGFAFTSIENSGTYVYKLKGSGNIDWGFGYSAIESNPHIEQTKDGGFILGGWLVDYINYQYDYGMIKLDVLGNILWQQAFGGDKDDDFTIIAQTSDGGFILGGSSPSDSSGDKTENSYGLNDYWIVKTKPDTLLATSSATTINNSEIKILASPNPSNGVFTIDIPLKGKATIEITNTFGQRVFYSEEKAQAVVLKKQIDIRGQASGMYFLRVEKDEMQTVKKIFIK